MNGATDPALADAIRRRVTTGRANVVRSAPAGPPNSYSNPSSVSSLNLTCFAPLLLSKSCRFVAALVAVSSPDSYPLDVDASSRLLVLRIAVVLLPLFLRVLLGGSSGSSNGALAAEEGRAAFRALRVATILSGLDAAVQR